MDNVPLGLDALIDVDQIFIKQHIETLEFLFGSNAANKYSITDPSGRNILYAAEFSNIFARHLIGKSRGFNLKIFNSVNNKEVLNAKRRFKCGLFACCLPRCLEDMQVESFGSVVQVMPSCCKMHFAINDEHGETHFEVRPPQKMIFFSDWEFQIFDAAGNNVGEIRKKWAGIGQEMFTSADNFGIKFPANLDVKYKALLISCCILLVSSSSWREWATKSLSKERVADIDFLSVSF